MDDAKKDDSNFEQNGLIRNRIWAFYYDEEHFGILGPMPFFCSPPIEVPMRYNSLVGTAKHSLNYAANLQRHK